MTEPTHKVNLPTCPNCGSNRVRRSIRKGAEDFVRRNLLFQDPYRCRACDERFFGFRVPRNPHKEPHPTT